MKGRGISCALALSVVILLGGCAGPAEQDEGSAVSQLAENWVETEAEDESSQVRAVLRASPAALTVGDRIRLDLSVYLPEGARILAAPDTVPPLTMLDVQPAAETDDGLAGWTYEAALFETGDHEVGPVAIRFATQEGEAGELWVGPVTLTVVSVLETGEEQLADIRGPVEVSMAKDAFVRAAYYVVGGFVLLVLLTGLLLWWRRWRAQRVLPEVPTPALPAHVIALRRIHALRDRHPQNREELKLWYVELSEALREYLENRFGVDALERTTAEMTFLLRSGVVPRRWIDPLLSWLSRSDLVKFAKSIPPEEQMAVDLEEAERFVLQTKQVVEDAATSERQEAI